MLTAIALAILGMETTPVTFRALTFNIWRGGTQAQPLAQVVDVIKASGADIVGIQEPDENLEKIAEGLRWKWSKKASLVTRFEIVEDWDVEGSRWGGAVVRLPNGRELVFLNTHLNPYPYGPYEIRDKKAADEKAATEVEERSGRVSQMKAMLDSLSSRATGRPVIFTGDFNTPSHLDWTVATSARNFGLTVRWPVTALAEDAGLRDAFRAIHPDPLQVLGFTWSPGHPVGKLDDDDVMDRIDFVLYRGLTAIGAWVVGESGPITHIAIDPWPSDHRAVVAEFRLE